MFLKRRDRKCRFDKIVRATLAVTQNVDARDNETDAQMILNEYGTIAYKSLVANVCLEIFKSKNGIMGKLWQCNYYEHIIRNEQSYQTISDYMRV